MSRVRVVKVVDTSGAVAAVGGTEVSDWAVAGPVDKAVAVGLLVTGTAPDVGIEYRTRQTNGGDISQWITLLADHGADAAWSGDAEAYGEKSFTMIDANWYQLRLTNNHATNTVVINTANISFLQEV